MGLVPSPVHDLCDGEDGWPEHAGTHPGTSAPPGAALQGPGTATSANADHDALVPGTSMVRLPLRGCAPGVVLAQHVAHNPVCTRLPELQHAERVNGTGQHRMV